ncbi:MAG: hypothetical protein ACFCUJ_09140 [Thiotrichales bacterium]
MNEVIPARTIQQITVDHTAGLTASVGELLSEIIAYVVNRVFSFDQTETTAWVEDCLSGEKSFVVVAPDAGENPAGFVTSCERHALYAEGTFGVTPELAVRPEFRSNVLSLPLVSQARGFGSSLGWKNPRDPTQAHLFYSLGAVLALWGRKRSLVTVD